MPFPDFLPYLIQFNAAPCTAFACHPQDVYTLLYICHLASFLHEGALPLVRHIQSANATFSAPNMAFRWAKCGIYVFKGPYPYIPR